MDWERMSNYPYPSHDIDTNISQSIGSFYAFILSRSERIRLTVVARSNYDAVAANGISINSQNHGKHHVKPDSGKSLKLVAKHYIKQSTVLRHVKDAGHKFDFVICTNKAVDQASTAADVAPAIGDDTSIVIIQNGVGNEDAFRDSFPKTTIISCVVCLSYSMHVTYFMTNLIRRGLEQDSHNLVSLNTLHLKTCRWGCTRIKPAIQSSTKVTSHSSNHCSQSAKPFSKSFRTSKSNAGKRSCGTQPGTP